MMPLGQSACLHLDNYSHAVIEDNRATVGGKALEMNIAGRHELTLDILRVLDNESLAAVASAGEWLAHEARSVMYERSPLRVELVQLPDDHERQPMHFRRVRTDRVTGGVA